MKTDDAFIEIVKKMAETQRNLNLKVKPNAQETKIKKIENNTIFLEIKELPEDGKANAAIEKFFERLLGKKVKLIGKRGRNKILKINL